MSSAKSPQTSNELSNSYNQSVTNTLGANSLNFTVLNSKSGWNQGEGASAAGGDWSSIGDISNFADSFNSQDVFNYVMNSGAGATTGGNPSASQGGGASMFDSISKWIPWIAAAGIAFIIVRYMRGK